MKFLTIVLSLFLTSCNLRIENVREDKCMTKCTKKYWSCMESYGDPMIRDCNAEKYLCLNFCRGPVTKK